MKRREFLITSGLAAAGIPLVARSAQPCPPPSVSVGEGTAASTACTATSTADWNERISGPDVVWYHNFDSPREVDAFRWTGGYRGGNDPLAVGRRSAVDVAWVASGGADGGGYLQITRNDTTVDGVHWWRPFSALDGESNGRGTDDPAASGRLRVGHLVATDGGSQTQNWCLPSNPRQGWYGHPSDQNDFYDGTEFWLQVRVMADPRRTTNPATKVGKFLSFTTTNATYTAQELVTYSAYWPGATSSAYTGMPNIHNVYQGHNYRPLADVSTGDKNPAGTTPWSYSFGWDTLLYHVSPGRHGVNETVFRVWAARQGETAYTKTWDVIYPAYYDSGSTNVGAVYRPGWNAFLAWIYQASDERNAGFTTHMPFWQRYDQIIFSKSFIPCPRT